MNKINCLSALFIFFAFLFMLTELFIPTKLSYDSIYRKMEFYLYYFFTSDDDYYNWNDTSIGHLCSILIMKNNDAIMKNNNTHLTRDEFNYFHNLLKGYIEWKKNNNYESNKIKSFYNYSIPNLEYILNNTNYDIDNESKLLKFWNKYIRLTKNNKNKFKNKKNKAKKMINNRKK